MKKSEKIILAAALAVVAAVFIAAAVFVLGRLALDASETRAFELNWDIDIPAASTVYRADDQGWFGDGTSYAVFKIKRETGVISELKAQPDRDFEEDFLEHAEKLSVGGAFLPAWGPGTVCGKLAENDDELWLVYDSVERLFYILAEYI